MEGDDDIDTLADISFTEFHRRFPVAAREMMREVIPKINLILEAQKDSPQKWGAAFAIGAGCCNGISMSEKAVELKCSRALLSFEARLFCEKLKLPPSGYMKSEEAAVKAQECRDRHCSKNLEKLIQRTRAKGITKEQPQ